ncbi:MAG: 6-carboxytetrahydropterin synthase [Solirubrobacterales bacterium]
MQKQFFGLAQKKVNRYLGVLKNRVEDVLFKLDKQRETMLRDFERMTKEKETIEAELARAQMYANPKLDVLVHKMAGDIILEALQKAEKMKAEAIEKTQSFTHDKIQLEMDLADFIADFSDTLADAQMVLQPTRQPGQTGRSSRIRTQEAAAEAAAARSDKIIQFPKSNMNANPAIRRIHTRIHAEFGAGQDDFTESQPEVFALANYLDFIRVVMLDSDLDTEPKIRRATAEANIRADGSVGEFSDLSMKAIAFLNAKHYVVFNNNKGPTHGHSWQIQMEAEIPYDASSVIRFNHFEEMLRFALEPFQRKVLNDIDPFGTVQPLTENIAIYIFNTMDEQLEAHNARLKKISVWENPTKGIEVMSRIANYFGTEKDDIDEMDEQEADNDKDDDFTLGFGE